MTREDVHKRLTNLTVGRLAWGFVAGGLVLMFVSTLPPQPWLTATLAQVGGLLLATGLVTWVWELHGRRTFTDEVMALAGLSHDLQRAGIVRVDNQYLEDQKLWDGLFRDVNDLVILVAYANTWRNTHRGRLEQVAKNPKARIRVYLPDVADELTVRNLARRFKIADDTLVTRVKESAADFNSLRTEGGAAIEVYFRPGDLLYSCYRFDSQALLTLYSHAGKRRSKVPTFHIRRGELLDFINDDLEAIGETVSADSKGVTQ